MSTPSTPSCAAMRSYVSGFPAAVCGHMPRGCSASAKSSLTTSIGEEGYEASTRHLGDFGLSYGAGGGVTIELASSARVRAALDIGLRYVTGGEVDYLTPGALQRDGNGVTFESVRSRVTLFDVQTGIAFGF